MTKKELENALLASAVNYHCSHGLPIYLLNQKAPEYKEYFTPENEFEELLRWQTNKTVFRTALRLVDLGLFVCIGEAPDDMTKFIIRTPVELAQWKLDRRKESVTIK